MLAGGGSAPTPEHYSGGYPVPKEKKHKFDSEAYAYVMRNMDALRNRVETLPEPVQQAIEIAIKIDDTAERELALAQQLAGIEFKFQRVYQALMERYRAAFIESELAREMELLQQRDDDEIILLLLLS